MRSFILTLALLLLAVTPALAGERGDTLAFGQCVEVPTAGGPYGDGTPAGELFALYAEEINPGVLVYPEELILPDEGPGPSAGLREAQLDGEGWYDPYGPEGPGT
jgi:hypothetical protein